MKLFSARKLNALRQQKGFRFLKKGQTGFTLIELLVVIGILGILAAALVATIDPFEQLKKADDSKIKNIAVEFQTANVRYYTTHGAFPWNDVNNTDANCTGIGGAAISSSLSSAGVASCISNALIREGELKQSFNVNTNDMSRVYVNWDPVNATNITVCFSPRSKSQKAAPDTKYTQAGAVANGATCPNANAADDTCYWCTQ